VSFNLGAIALAKQIATDQGLDPATFCGLVERESSWNNWAIRYEPAFFLRYIIPLDLQDTTEERARAFSWGPCQIMGQLARELGYKGDLANLCDWQVGLEWGAKALAHRGSLQAYNGGGNPNYAAEVMKLAASYA
jgi:soluble lytic murein transglycosylase-like protein